jgi:rubrerythrin
MGVPPDFWHCNECRTESIITNALESCPLCGSSDGRRARGGWSWRAGAGIVADAGKEVPAHTSADTGMQESEETPGYASASRPGVLPVLSVSVPASPDNFVRSHPRILSQTKPSSSAAEDFILNRTLEQPNHIWYCKACGNLQDMANAPEKCNKCGANRAEAKLESLPMRSDASDTWRCPGCGGLNLIVLVGGPDKCPVCEPTRNMTFNVCSNYQKVAVLLIKWTDEVDNPGTHQEVHMRTPHLE